MSDRVRLEMGSLATTPLSAGGPPTSFTVSIFNDSAVVDTFALSIDGVEADWCSIDPATVSLFPGEQAEAQVEIRVPTGALAGTHELQLIATSRADPTQSTRISLSFEILAGAIAPEVTGALELSIAPLHQTVRGQGSAESIVRARNSRNEPVSLQMLASDPDDLLDLTIGPAQMVVPPGGEASATVQARPRREMWVGQPRTLPFFVTALSADAPLEPPLARIGGELEQTARLPVLGAFAALPAALRQRIPLALAALAALALLVWFLAGPGLRSTGVPTRPTPTIAVAAASPSPEASPSAIAGSTGANAAPANGSNGLPPTIARFGLAEPNDAAPAFLPLTWQVTNADDVKVVPKPDSQADADGNPSAVQHTELTLHATNKNGVAEQVLNLYVLRPPRIDTFELEVAQNGAGLTVTYRTAGADSLALNGQTVPGPNGSVELPASVAGGGPIELKAANGAGEASRSVSPPPPGPTRTPTSSPTPRPSLTPTRTVTPTASSTPTETETPEPTSTSTRAPATATRPPTATSTETAVPPTDTETPVPPTHTATAVPPTATHTPVPEPTDTPLPEPTDTPTLEPTPTDTPEPTETPTATATAAPTVELPPPPEQGETRLGIAEGFRNPSTMADTHANWERIVLSWQDVQPNGPGDFSRLGQTITNAQVQGEVDRGVKLAGLLQFTPGWAQANPSNGQRSPPKNLNLPYDDPNNYWGQFVYQTVKFYGGRIDEFVVWNEPEFKPGEDGAGGSTTWLGTDAEFAQLLKVAYLAAKKANPNATVSFPGTSYWIDQNANRPQFYDRLLTILQSDPDAAKAGFYHDVVALNLYRNPDDLLRVYQVFKEIQARHGIDKPVWLTESNAMPTDDTVLKQCDHGGDPIKTSLQEQASFSIQAFAMAAATNYNRIGWYQMVDANPCNEPAVWGVVRDDGSKRPVEDSLRTAITNFLGFTSAQFVPLARAEQRWSPWPDDPNSYTPNWEVYQVALDKPGGQRVTVLWNGDGPVAAALADAAASGAQPPGGLVVRIPKRGNSAHAIGKFGVPYPYFQEQNGYWVVYLAPATATYDQDPPGYHFIGGDPVLIVEDGVPQNALVDPPQLLTGGGGDQQSGPTDGGGDQPPADDGGSTGTDTGNGGAQAGGGDFRLAVNPPGGLTIHQGEAADFTLTSQALNGFKGPINLAITRWSTQRFPDPKPADTLPLSVTMPSSVTPGRPVVIHVETSDQNDVGIYFLTLEGSGNGVTKTVDIALVVDPPSD